MNADTATAIGHVTILIATVAGLYYNWRREGRAHRWQQHQEDVMGTIRRAMRKRVQNGDAKLGDPWLPEDGERRHHERRHGDT